MAKKKTTETIIGVDLSHPRLVSYTLKSVIRTGEYESLTPEITVEAATINEAHAFAMEHIKELHAKYSMNIPRTHASQAPQLSEHYFKVLKAIQSTSDGEALKSYEASVEASIKLTALEKKNLHEAIQNQLLK